MIRHFVLLLLGCAVLDGQATSGGKPAGAPPRGPTAANQQSAADHKSDRDTSKIVVRITDAQGRRPDSAKSSTNPPANSAAELWIAWLTAGLVFVGASQALLFWWQLRLLNRSLADAKAATLAAKESASANAKMAATMDASAKRQLRAYVSIGTEKTLPVARGEMYAFTVHMSVENGGVTPASEVVTMSDIRLLPHPLPPGFSLPLRGTPSHPSLVPPRGAIRNECRGDEAYTRDEIGMAVTEGARRLWLFGRVSYIDVFGEHREDSFRFTGYDWRDFAPTSWRFEPSDIPIDSPRDGL